MWRRVHDAKELGQAVRDLRKHRDMTQGELAEWLSVDRTTVVRLEAGNVQALQRLMGALSVLGADVVVADRSAHINVSEVDFADEAPTGEV